MTPQQLKDHRKAKGWDQEEAAKQLKVSIHTIRSWEQGKNPIPGIVEKHLLSEVDLKTPLELIVDINSIAAGRGEAFEPTYYEVLRIGIAALKAKEESATPRPTSKKRGAKPG